MVRHLHLKKKKRKSKQLTDAVATMQTTAKTKTTFNLCQRKMKTADQHGCNLLEQ